MVLEHLIPESWIENKIWVAMLLGFGFSLIGSVMAFFIFRSNAGLASVVFVSLLLIPSLRKLLVREEKLEEKEKKFSFLHLYKDNKHLLLGYLGIFVGVFSAYYLVSALGAFFGIPVQTLFREQVFLDPLISGRATFDTPTFFGILLNNWWVLAICFLLSLISGDGASFFVVWNASAWGVIFGLRTLGATAVTGQPMLFVGLSMLVIVGPHILLEGMAYLLSGIAGSVISDEVVAKSKELRPFLINLLLFLGIFFGIRSLVLSYVYGYIIDIFFILLFLGLLYLLKHSFSVKQHIEVFIYNYWLFVVAIAIFILGALVETFVLSNSGLLHMYYSASDAYFSLF